MPAACCYEGLQPLQFFDDAKGPVPVEQDRLAGRQHVDPMPQILHIGRIKDVPHRRPQDAPKATPGLPTARSSTMSRWHALAIGRQRYLPRIAVASANLDRSISIGILVVGRVRVAQAGLGRP
jgi:hypothetical protein